MPNVVTEFVLSRTTTIGSSPQHEKIYIVRGTDDESVALAAAWNGAPNTFGGSGIFPYLTKRNATVEPTHVEEGNANACVWTSTITYLLPQGGTGGGPDGVFSFDTGGGTKHITQSIATVAANSVANVTANVSKYANAIGYRNNQGVEEIEGVDIVSGVFNFKITKYLSDACVSDAYRNTLANMTGTVNNANFKGFANGEVRYDGTAGSKRDSDNVWELVFNFSVLKNRTNVAVGDTMIFPNVKGWEYLWIVYAPYPAATSGAKKVPVEAYLEKVYNYSNFAQLLIGT
jgi:hypothetical protein